MEGETFDFVADVYWGRLDILSPEEPHSSGDFYTMCSQEGQWVTQGPATSVTKLAWGKGVPILFFNFKK